MAHIGRRRQFAGQEAVIAVHILGDDLQDEVGLARQHIAFPHQWPIGDKLFEGKLRTDPSELGVTRKELVNRRSGGPVTQTLDPIAAVIGVGDFDIYVSSRSPEMIDGLAGDRPALVIGHSVVTTIASTPSARV